MLPQGAKGVKMKKRSMLWLLGFVVLMALLFGCSNMPTENTDDNTGNVTLRVYQYDRPVDSLRVGIYTVFRINVPGGVNNITSYDWDFGDTTSVFNTEVNQCDHRYDNPGSYQLIVRVNFASGGSMPYTFPVRVYSGGSTDDILRLISATQNNNGRWTYRLGLSIAACSGDNSHPFVTGTQGVVVTNPYSTTYSWLQLITTPAVDGRYVVEVTCYNQEDIFLNYGGNFIPTNPSSAWGWATIGGSEYFQPEGGGGNLHFSLINGQLLPVGSNSQLPGLLGDENPSTLRMTVVSDSVRLYFSLDRLSNFNGGGYVEYVDNVGITQHVAVGTSEAFNGWLEFGLPVSTLGSPVMVRYGHQDSVLANMSSSKYWVASDQFMEFYLVTIPESSRNPSGWEIRPVRNTASSF